MDQSKLALALHTVYYVALLVKNLSVQTASLQSQEEAGVFGVSRTTF